MVKLLSTTSPLCISSEYSISQFPSIAHATITASNNWNLYCFTNDEAKSNVDGRTGIIVQPENNTAVCINNSSLDKASNRLVVFKYSEIT